MKIDLKKHSGNIIEQQLCPFCRKTDTELIEDIEGMNVYFCTQCANRFSVEQLQYAGGIPLAQPVRRTGRDIGENQTVLGRS